MSSAKAEILRKIRQAVGPQSLDEISRRYQQAGTLSLEARCELFKDRLIDYGSVVHYCSDNGISHTVAEVLQARGKSGLVVPRGIERSWLPAGFNFRVDEQLSYAELDECEGALTGSAGAIALTGTIVLRHSVNEGRRALTLIPDYHLCLVGLLDLVETVVEGVRQMARFGTAPMTTISGPSATSDIEMTRIKGVHGPRVLDVIVWGG